MRNKCCGMAYAQHYSGCKRISKKQMHIDVCPLVRPGNTCGHFDAPKYGLEGLTLTINGQGALVLNHVLLNNGPVLSPADASILAHRIVNALNEMEDRRLVL